MNSTEVIQLKIDLLALTPRQCDVICWLRDDDRDQLNGYPYWLTTIKSLIARGLVEQTPGRQHLTPRGWNVAHWID